MSKELGNSWTKASWNWAGPENITGMHYYLFRYDPKIFGAIGKDEKGWWANRNTGRTVYRPDVADIEELKKFAEVMFRMNPED